MREAGALLASGRDADIFECGPGFVLRRARVARSLVAEADIMRLARDAGYPVPAVEEVSADGRELVMERVDGPSMVDRMLRRPWDIAGCGRVLADLHQRLHEIEAPGWLHPGPVTPGDRFIHLDLHPLNVIMGPRGPVVIDWSNAARGDPAVDVGAAWILVGGAQVPGPKLLAWMASKVRQLFVRAFLGGVDPAVRERAAELLEAVVDWKSHDAHISPSEIASMRKLAVAAGKRAAHGEA